MHAITMHRTGGPEVLEWSDRATPAVGENDLLVRLEAAGLNYIDTYHRRGIYPVELPLTPGIEGAGSVMEAGEAVTEVAVGDRVAWTGIFGSYAEEVIVPADRSVPVPVALPTDVAAAVILQGLTAHYLVHDTYPLTPEDACLVHAGAGGVGLLLIQMAKRLGATVFTTVSTDQKAELAAEAGADHVIRYDDVDFGVAVEAIAGPKPLSVVYDGVGVVTFERGLELLRPRGTMALFGQSSGVVPPFDLAELARLGSLYVTRPTLFNHIADRADLLDRAGEVLGWVSDGSLSVRIGQHFPLADAADAHRALEARTTTGKTLLIP